MYCILLDKILLLTMKKYIDVNCAQCLQCCHFHLFVNEHVTLEELEDNFFYNQELCDTFFKKENGTYFVKESCIQDNNGICRIHDDNLPSLCALFPFMVVYTKKNTIELVVDKNCPEHKNLLIAIKNQETHAEIMELIRYYYNNDRLLLLEKKLLSDLGYRLKTVCIIENLF